MEYSSCEGLVLAASSRSIGMGGERGSGNLVPRLRCKKTVSTRLSHIATSYYKNVMSPIRSLSIAAIKSRPVFFIGEGQARLSKAGQLNGIKERYARFDTQYSPLASASKSARGSSSGSVIGHKKDGIVKITLFAI